VARLWRPRKSHRPGAVTLRYERSLTELFPVSSLGHSVLLPEWIGGSSSSLATQSAQSNSEQSFYLAYIVGLHVATALALLVFFRADWVLIVRGFVRSLPRSVSERRLIVRDSDERLAWLIVFATIPVGITGLALEQVFRTVFAKPVAASAFLFANGLILLAGERYRRRAKTRPQGAARAVVPAADEPRSASAGDGRSAQDVANAYASDVRIAQISYRDGTRSAHCGSSPCSPGLAAPGSRWSADSGVALTTRLRPFRVPARHARDPRPGVLKLPSLAGHAGDHIHGQLAVGFVITGITAYLSVRYLVRYFETRTLTPFAVYSLAVGAISLLRFAAF